MKVWKKKIITIALTTFIALYIGWNFNQSKNELKLSQLAFTNVEALAEGESGIPTIPCEQGGKECTYIVKDLNGNYYNASSPGMKNKYN